MQLRSAAWCCSLALIVTVGPVEPASASTFIRQSLDDLVADNATIVVGEVVDLNSYWNDESTFILTDVRFEATEVLKGDRRETDLAITVLGGSVGDLTTVIVGGAELVPGKSYLLFLDQDDLPGVLGVRTVREHSQGVFDIVRARDGMRAISQANRHPLYPDALGFVDPPGGAKGFLLDHMLRSIRENVNARGARQEVK